MITQACGSIIILKKENKMPERIIDMIDKLQEWPYFIFGITQVVKDWLITNVFNILKMIIISVAALFALYTTFNSLVMTVEANTKVLHVIASKLEQVKINQAINTVEVKNIAQSIPDIKALEKRVGRIEGRLAVESTN